MITVGSSIPDFSLPDEYGHIYTPASFTGKKWILYFYPKDDTPGCTTEACSFRDNYFEFEKRDIPVVGIGKGNANAHKRFKEKYHLPFILLVDHGLEVCRTFGVLKEKSMFGKSYDGIMRTSFLVDESGNIAHIWENVNPMNHAGAILEMIAV